jgi:hypothetical protein
MENLSLQIDSPVSREIGKCIYCGYKSTGLAKEHVIPEAIFGNIILLQACCKNCEAIINPFEQKTLRKTWGIARYRLHITGKRKKLRAAEMPKLMDSDGRLIQTTYEFGHTLLPMLEPKSMPNLVTGIERHTWHGDLIKLCVVSLSERTQEDYDHITGSFEPSGFYRSIVKIAYGLAVYRYGLGNFAQLTNAFIINSGETMDSAADFLGAETTEVDSGNLHEWDTYEFRNGELRYIAVRFRPFSFISRTVYHVVAGVL